MGPSEQLNYSQDSVIKTRHLTFRPTLTALT